MRMISRYCAAKTVVLLFDCTVQIKNARTTRQMRVDLYTNHAHKVNCLQSRTDS